MITFASKLALGILAAALAHGTVAQARATQAAAPSWLLKPAINPLPNWYEVRGGTWRVPRDVVEDMAARIDGEMGSRRGALHEYTIQYQGTSSGAARAIRLMGACAARTGDERQLSERFHVVFDGGRCYFDATYDAQEKRFTHFAYHGPR